MAHGKILADYLSLKHQRMKSIQLLNILQQLCNVDYYKSCLKAIEI